MTLTTSSSTGASAASTVSDKDWGDFLRDVVPDAVRMISPTVGIDPRVAGQTASQLLGLFGIGGAGKAFVSAVPKDQVQAQLRQLLSPHLDDVQFRTALSHWLQAAVEPARAQKEGKAYQPSVDLSKSWFSDITDSIGDAVSKVDWGEVAQIGMRALPYVVAAL